MKKILVVEADQNIAETLSGRPKSIGSEVSVAPDASTGVEAAIDRMPNLIPLDISLPAGNGFTVAERIQSLILTAKPPRVVTASKKPGQHDKPKEIGTATFFQNPCQWEITPPKILRIAPRQSQFIPPKETPKSQ